MTTIPLRPAPDVHEPRPLVVCADGSAGRGGPAVAGIAWVAADGDFAWDTVATRSALVAELAAIEAAILAAPAKRALVVLTDSRPAIHAIETLTRTGIVPLRATAPHRQAATKLITRVVRESARRAVELRWVRGHAGHPLNEAADRLAVQARRCGQNGGHLAALAPLARRIVAEHDRCGRGSVAMA